MKSVYPEIYFVRAAHFASPIKVGFSIRLDRRMVDIGKWVPFPLEILARFPVLGSNVCWDLQKQCRLFEGRFHERYKAYRLHHEWFEPHGLLLADIEAINAGTFDPRCLPAGKMPPEHVSRIIPTSRGLAIEYARFLTPAQAKKEVRRIAA